MTMDKKIKLITVIVSAFVIFVALLLLSETGIYVSDYYSTLHKIPFYYNWDWLFVTGGVVLFVLSIILALKNKKMRLLLCVSAIMLAGTTICTAHFYGFVSGLAPAQGIQNNHIEDISIQELKNIPQNEGTSIVYFYRSGCENCAEFTPVLSDTLKAIDQGGIFAYDTQNDREDNYNMMMETLKRFKVEDVPTLTIMKNGRVVKVYSEKNELKDFKQYVMN